LFIAFYPPPLLIGFPYARGVGITKDKDGICYKNVLATYTHIHALGTPQWVHALVRNAITHQKKKLYDEV
jgi:cobyrinic acid a,c-diamide synthase